MKTVPVESPASLLDLTCPAARSGPPLTVGLGPSSAEKEHVDAFLDSGGDTTDRVVALDAASLGGTSRLCFATSDGRQWRVVRIEGRGPEGEEGIVLSDSVGSYAHHVWYRIGETEASPPAKIDFANGGESSGPSHQQGVTGREAEPDTDGGGS